VVLGLVAGGAGPVARAQPTEARIAEADRLFEEGVAAVQAGDVRGGLRAFRASFDLSRDADVLFNIAVCLKTLGDAPSAANAFREYAEMVGDTMTAEERAEIEAFLAELTPRIGRISVEASQPDAVASVDGVEVAVVGPGAWYAVSPGAHEVAVRREGFAPFSTRVDVAAGQAVTVPAVLTATEPSPLPASPSSPAPSPPPLPVSEPTTDDRQPATGGFGGWFWTSVGIASAAAVGMAVTGGLAIKYNEDYDASGNLDAGLRDTTLALRTTTDVLLGVALAAAVAAEPVNENETPAGRIYCSASWCAGAGATAPT
jgi:hypothetical protein